MNRKVDCEMPQLDGYKGPAGDFVAYFKLNEPAATDMPQATIHIAVSPSGFVPGDLQVLNRFRSNDEVMLADVTRIEEGLRVLLELRSLLREEGNVDWHRGIDAAIRELSDDDGRFSPSGFENA